MLRHADSKSGQAPLRSGAGRKRARRNARAVLDRPPPAQGWRTTDEDEIALRRWRGCTEIVAIEELEQAYPFFGTFRAQSGSGGFYEVEIRSLDGFANSCGCIDHRVNGLGTCKHIEGVLAALEGRRAKALRADAVQGNLRVEVYLDRRDTATPTVSYPAADTRATKAARSWPAATASRACWWSARPRSRPSGRSRSRASPTARRARCSGRGRRGCSRTASPCSSPS